MDLKTFERYIAVVEFGTIKNAAAIMCMDDSALGKQMRQLEDIYGPLFKGVRRGRSQLELTVAGQKVYTTAKTLLQQLTDLKKETDNLQNNYQQILRLAIVPGLSQLIYSRYLAPMAKHYPSCSFWVLEPNVQQQEQAVLQGEAELGFSNSALQHPWEFDILQSTPQDYYVVCRKDTPYLDTTQASLNLQGLANVPLCLTVNSSYRLLKAFEEAKIAPRIVSFNTMRQTSIFAAKLGIGVTVYPMTAPLRDEELLRLPLAEPGLTSEEILYKHKGHELSPLAQVLVDLYCADQKQL